MEQHSDLMLEDAVLLYELYGLEKDDEISFRAKGPEPEAAPRW